MSKYEPMNPEVKAKWLEALRGGKYGQCITYLRQGDSYCCLGVLCDLLKPAGWSGEDDEHSDDVRWFNGTHEELPPDFICQAAGLPEAETVHSSEPERNNATEQLAYLNDCGKSFAEIADFIEENL